MNSSRTTVLLLALLLAALLGLVDARRHSAAHAHKSRGSATATSYEHLTRAGAPTPAAASTHSAPGGKIASQRVRKTLTEPQADGPIAQTQVWITQW